MRKKRYGKRKGWISAALCLAVFVAIALWTMSGVRQASETSQKEGLRQAELAVRRAAATCYAMEGAYPATYQDLKDKSGIAVDEEEYKVYYEIFASNIMPELTVVRLQS